MDPLRQEGTRGQRGQGVVGVLRAMFRLYPKAVAKYTPRTLWVYISRLLGSNNLHYDSITWNWMAWPLEYRNS